MRFGKTRFVSKSVLRVISITWSYTRWPKLIGLRLATAFRRRSRFLIIESDSGPGSQFSSQTQYRAWKGLSKALRLNPVHPEHWPPVRCEMACFRSTSFHSKEWPAFMNFPIFLSRKRLCVHRSSIGASVFLFVKKAFVLVIQFQGSSSRHPSNFIRIQQRSWLWSLPQNDVASNRNSL